MFNCDHCNKLLDEHMLNILNGCEILTEDLICKKCMLNPYVQNIEEDNFNMFIEKNTNNECHCPVCLLYNKAMDYIDTIEEFMHEHADNENKFDLFKEYKMNFEEINNSKDINQDFLYIIISSMIKDDDEDFFQYNFDNIFTNNKYDEYFLLSLLIELHENQYNNLYFNLITSITNTNNVSIDFIDYIQSNHDDIINLNTDKNVLEINRLT